jgi:preprotein translocase subunit SecG
MVMMTMTTTIIIIIVVVVVRCILVRKPKEKRAFTRPRKR